MNARARWSAALLGLLTVFLAPLAAYAQPIEQTVEEHRDDRGEIDRFGSAFVHRASGYVYPAKLGELPARKTITFGRADAEVFYTLQGGSGGDAWISLYVYPARTSLADEKRGVEAIIVENYGAKATARPAIIGAPPAGVVEGWFRASIKGADVFTGARIAEVNGWNIKMRVSIPVSGGQAALERASRAVAEIMMTPPALRPANVPSPSQPAIATTR